LNEVKQIGNYETESTWDNPQTGRVYSADGISLTLNTCNGGDRQPKIVESQVKCLNTKDKNGRQPSQHDRVYDTSGIMTTIDVGTGGRFNIIEPFIVASRGRNPQNPSDRTPGNHVEQRLEPNSEGICNTLTSVQKDNLVLETNTFIRVTEDGFHLARNDEKQSSIQGTHVTFKNGKAHCMGTSHIPKVLEPTVKIKQATKDGYIECKLGGVADLSFPTSKTRRGRVQDNGDTCPTLTATETGVCRIETPYRIRKLTPLECWRLMDFTDEDFHKAEAVNSNTQLYKQAGNSIVKAVLMAIFKQMM
jgi:DNA (cytosine-5)-methyltransferase 1